MDHCHWLVATGDSWSSIADATGLDRLAVARANGLNPPATGTITPQPKVGAVIHLPFWQA